MNKIDRLRAQLKRIDVKIGELMSHRVDVEEEFAEAIARDANRCPQHRPRGKNPCAVCGR